MPLDDPADTISMIADNDDASSDERGRRTGLFLLAIAAALIVFWWFLSQTTVVPDLMGMTQADGRTALRDADLRIGAVGEIPSTRQKPGNIADQAPINGARVWRGSSIDVFLARAVSVGADGGVDEPPSGGFLPPDDAYESGGNFSQQPAPRTYAPNDTGMVPMVQALSERAARAKLRASGFGVTVKYGPVTTGPGRGRVYYQNPEPNAFTEPGSTVVIWVNNGGSQSGPYPKPEE